ncbi:hypothetical protein GN958_ATG08742 [Phytophthora infestans]|uniref:Uncharacterized protein n=1 Tax=Phytophthora infestans TaxID=4787 RepID=A0A8S9URR8_PHYIN|nr:hypothetical protein GN958_ATG08742 [Phytophthora infestans]
MEDELPVHRLPRYEKKRLVKGWHAIQAPSNAPRYESSGSDRIGRAGSMRSLFATPPGALAYEFEQSSTWRSSSSSTQERSDQQQDEKLPKTVAQVKRAYRARARKQEADDASEAIRKREMILEQRRGHGRSLQATAKPQQSLTFEPHQDDVTNEASNEENVSADEQEGECLNGLQLLDLPVDEILTNTTYRDEVLRRIRHQLSVGDDVLLQSDCVSVSETVKSTRLMMQTLCTQSLAYCVHDQDVVPDTSSLSPSKTRLALRLLPRHQSTTSLQ